MPGYISAFRWYWQIRGCLFTFLSRWPIVTSRFSASGRNWFRTIITTTARRRTSEEEDEEEKEEIRVFCGFFVVVVVVVVCFFVLFFVFVFSFVFCDITMLSYQIWTDSPLCKSSQWRETSNAAGN